MLYNNMVVVHVHLGLLLVQLYYIHNVNQWLLDMLVKRLL